MNRIEHYTTYLQGGAGIAARRIFDGIRDALDNSNEKGKSNVPDPSDFELVLRCRDDQQPEGPGTEQFHPSTTFLKQYWTWKWNRKSFKQASQHYDAHLKNRPKEFEGFSPARMFDPTARPARPSVNLIHLHWVAYLLDYQTFLRSLPASVPILWTLHDMNPFTGGCHYTSGCDRYLSGCGNCFQLANPRDDDLSAVALAQKKAAFKLRELTIVAPSQWLTNLAQQSGVFAEGTHFETIEYGLDTEAYQPIEREAAKHKLGFDPKKTTLLFGAADLAVLRKGAKPLFEAICKLPDPNQYEFVVFGDGAISENDLSQVAKRMEVKQIGYLKTDEEKRTAYSAANAFLLPSLEDNQPQTGLESLACGTPVIAFDTGGIPEFVQHGKTGLLAKVNDPESLANQIRWIAESPDAQTEFGQNGRKLIEERFEIRSQTRKYLKLYRQLLARGGRRIRKAG